MSAGYFVERELLAQRLERARSRGEVGRVVLANGCFDVLHVGHVRYLDAARELGDVLVVALNDDDSVRAIKGAGRPHVPLVERAEVLLALESVDYVVHFGEETADATLRVLVPDVHAKGTDYTEETVPERATDLELAIEIRIVGDEKSHASRELIARLSAS